MSTIPLELRQKAALIANCNSGKDLPMAIALALMDERERAARLHDQWGNAAAPGTGGKAKHEFYASTIRRGTR